MRFIFDRVLQDRLAYKDFEVNLVLSDYQVKKDHLEKLEDKGQKARMVQLVRQVLPVPQGRKDCLVHQD